MWRPGRRIRGHSVIAGNRAGMGATGDMEPQSEDQEIRRADSLREIVPKGKPLVATATRGFAISDHASSIETDDIRARCTTLSISIPEAHTLIASIITMDAMKRFLDSITTPGRVKEIGD